MSRNRTFSHEEEIPQLSQGQQRRYSRALCTYCELLRATILVQGPAFPKRKGTSVNYGCTLFSTFDRIARWHLLVLPKASRCGATVGPCFLKQSADSQIVEFEHVSLRSRSGIVSLDLTAQLSYPTQHLLGVRGISWELVNSAAACK